MVPQKVEGGFDQVRRGGRRSSPEVDRLDLRKIGPLKISPDFTMERLPVLFVEGIDSQLVIESFNLQSALIFFK